MSMMIDPLNERSTNPDPIRAEQVGHHGSRLARPWLTFGAIVLLAAVVVVLALVFG